MASTSSLLERGRAEIVTHDFLRVAFRSCYEPAEGRSVFDRWLLRADAPPELARHFTRQKKAMVLDESHFMRNPETVGFAACMFAMRCARVRVCMSGTPVHNAMLDLATQLQLCDAVPEFQSEEAFRRMKPAQLRRLRATCVRRTDARLDIPPLQHVSTTLTMPDEEKAVLRGEVAKCVGKLSAFSRAAEGSRYCDVLGGMARIRQASTCHTALVAPGWQVGGGPTAR